MIIKQKFRLVSNAPNILSVSSSVIKSYEKEENSPRHVFAVLELKKKSIQHFSNDTIFKLISDTQKRKKIHVVNFEQYPLAATYNKPTKGLIVNLKSFEVSEISNINPNDLYAALVYSYSFSKFVNKKVKIPQVSVRSIVNYLTSLYVQVFGKEYGLAGIYAAGIPKLKFVVGCYILAAFFGHPINKSLFKEASKIAPFMYSNELDALKQYDFMKIEDFIKCLSDLKVMPGLTLIRFTQKLYNYMGVDMLPAMEDLSRFFSIILTSSIRGSSIVPTSIYRYNEKEYFKLVDIGRKVFK